MRRYTFYPCIMGILFLGFCLRANGQGAPADSSSQQNALNSTVNLFYSSIGKQSPLFNGTESYPYDPIIKGNAYYADVNAFTPSSVFYDNVHFTGVPILYDIYGDQV